MFAALVVPVLLCGAVAPVEVSSARPDRRSVAPATTSTRRVARRVPGSSRPRATRERSRPAATAGSRRPRPDGRLRVAPGESAVHGAGRALRFAVAVERHLGIGTRPFAERVEQVLFSPRGWRASGLAFRRVSQAPFAFRVILASPRTTDRLCAPAQTHGRLSCHNDGRVVVNALRWRRGAPAYRSLQRYRTYVVNHEVGHALGHGHRACVGRGPAPVMMQQTIGVGNCRARPWPLPSELR